MSDEPTFLSDDPIGEIDDRIARYLARTIVHVRRFFPFYAGGAAFFVAMLVLPVVGGGGSGTPASVAGPSGAAGVAGSGATAAAATGGRSALGAGAAAASFLGGGSSDLVSFFSDDGGAGVDDEVAAGALAGGAGSFDGRRTGSPTDGVDTPVPDTPSSDIPDEPEVPSACTVSPPSPAPTVTPAHEISGAQDTVEAAAGQQLPADAASTSAPVTDDAVCSVPDAPVDVPSVPLPATPVGGPTAGGSALRVVLALLF